MSQTRLKSSEAYPLLDPDEAGEKPLDKSAAIPVEWNVTCTPKRPSWISRWPQFVSACWMSVVLLTIMFVIFYAFGTVYKLQEVMLKYEYKPTREVYLHYIVPKDNSVSFKTFENYLSFMATENHQLNFNVRILIDNSPRNFIYTRQSESIFTKRISPEYTDSVRYIFIKNNNRDIQEIQRKHPNINVSVLALNKYALNTPFRYKWRSMPVTYLPFYVSAYEVWKNGGIGLNLLTQNYRFNLMKRIDFKLNAILKQHSKISDLSKYSKTLNKIDILDERQFLALLFDVFNEIPRIFKTIYSFGMVSDKRDIRAAPMTSMKEKRSIPTKDILKNTYNDTETKFFNNKSHDTVTKKHDRKIDNSTQINNATDANNVTVTIKNYSEIVKDHEFPKNALHVCVYETSRQMNIIADFVDVENTPDFNNKNSYQSNYLALSSDGTIIAAYSRNHPFLSNLLFKPRTLFFTTPWYVISNSFQESCYRSNRADYCDSLKIFNIL